MNNQPTDARLIEATNLKNQGKKEDATRLLQEVLKENLENPEALQILGQISYDENNFDVARDLFKESLKLDPTQPHVWNHLGQVLNDLREPDEAAEMLNKALELNPDFGRAYKNLANIKFNRGDRDEGIELAYKALEVNPDLFGTYLILTKAKAIKVGDPLVGKMETLLGKNQGNPGACGMLHYALSYVFEQAGDTEKFFFHLNKANACNKPTDDSWKEKLNKRVENIKSLMTSDFLAAKVSEARK
ncbi:MAG: tetratricopeptide repeat protein, partial [Sphingomonadales bacterium]